MKRGGLVFAVLVLVTGILRFANPGGFGRAESGQAGPTKPKDSVGAEKKRPVESLQDELKRRGFDEEIKTTIQEFFGQECNERDSVCADELSKHWNVPHKARPNVRFIIALLPDPKHTHLSLLLDRGIDAIEQAAQSRGYDFDRAVLPWPSTEYPPTDNILLRLLEEDFQVQNEQFPGLLIFRESVSRIASLHLTTGAETRRPSSLFVLVVGEKPTGGINKKQFSSALQFIRDIQAPTSEPNSPLYILGPTFSGSLYSLDQLLQLDGNLIRGSEVFTYSGSLRGFAQSCWFGKRRENQDPSFHFRAFQENENEVLARFDVFARSSGYPADEIAVLSEDETSYGASFNDPLVALNSECRTALPTDWLKLQFPRGISQFRSAYQRTVSSSEDQDVAAPGSAMLRLDMDATGEDDGVPTFARSQTPMSQEGVMRGIVATLHQWHPKLVVLRSTDPLDQLFLARYLRNHYPEGRLVIVAPDLFLAREEETNLQGIVAISAYPLVPREEFFIFHSTLPRQFDEERIFVSSTSVGTFNAAVALLAQGDQFDDSRYAARSAGPSNPPTSKTPPSEALGRAIPPAEYADFGSPVLAGSGSAASDFRLSPGVWVSILSSDGYWAMKPIDLTQKNSHDTLPVSSGKLDTRGVPGIREPKSWKIVYFLILLVLYIHVYLSWTGSVLNRSEIWTLYGNVEESSHMDQQTESFPDRRRRAVLLAIGTALPAAGLFLLLCAWLASRDMTLVHGLTAAYLFGLPLILALGSVVEIWKRRREPLVASALAAVVVLFCLCSFFPRYWFPGAASFLCARRLMHLASGVSPLLPALLLSGAGMCAVWCDLRGLALVDLRRPRLPMGDLPRGFERLGFAAGEDVWKTMRPFSIPWQARLALLLFYFLLAVLFGSPSGVIQTLEGPLYDRFLGYALGVLVLVFVGCLAKLFSTWNSCQVILSGLDRVQLRDAFQRLKDFSWGPLWSVRGGALRDSYKFLSRELEGVERLARALPDLPQAVATPIGEVQNSFKMVMAYYRSALAEASQIPKLMEAFEALQLQLAKLASTVLTCVLVPCWNRDVGPVASSMPAKLRTQRTAVELGAEEFVSFIYANYLVTVLLRMRTMVVAAIGMYIFILLAISSYPFSPSPMIFTLALTLIVLLVSAIGIVYAQMHREATLSRLTDTKEGQLGSEFWLQFGSAGALPILTLFAAQFPAISRVVYSFLQPILQSVK